MADPFHHDPASFNQDRSTSSLPRIRTSYASIVSGSNPMIPSPSPVALNSLSYVLNHPADLTSDLYSTHPSTRSRSMDAGRSELPPQGTVSAIPSQTSSMLPKHSRMFEMHLDNGSWTCLKPYRNYDFLIPSYLRGSSYMQKLEEAHKAKQLRKENQQQSAGGMATTSPVSPMTTKIPASHLGMTFDLIERAPTLNSDEQLDPLPTKWNKDDKWGALDVFADGLEVKYNQPVRNSREPDHEVCGIRANHPMPSRAGIYYFEITLLSKRRDETQVCIGFQGKSVTLARPPGWEPDSWGYHGDDGEIYTGNHIGKRYASSFGSQDTVGCGVNFRTGEAFFTKNGVFFGVAFRDIKGKLYPVIGMKKPGEHVRVNFGQTPFYFNIDDMVRRETETLRRAIAETSIEKLVSPPMNETGLVQQLVLQFLQHDGYVETARSFAQEIQAEKESLRVDPAAPIVDVNIRDDKDAHQRQRIRSAILEGNIDKALKYTNVDYPRVLEDNSHVYFKLRCRKFIEMVRRSAESTNGSGKKSNGHSYDDAPNKMDVDENGSSDKMEEDTSDEQADDGNLLVDTIAYGQSLQAEFKGDPRPETKTALNEIFALLAYPNPSQVKEVAPLLDRKGRVAVAEELNSAILASLGKSSRSALENLYGQTSVLLDYLREDGGPGSFITIQSIINEISQQPD